MATQPTNSAIRRDIFHFLKNNGRKAYRPKEIAKRLNYSDNQVYRRFREVLAEMGEQQVIGRAKGGRYTYKPRRSRNEGILHVTPKGFGFVEVPGRAEDLYVRAGNMGTALDGDRVQVGLAATARGDRREEAEVLKVLQRRRQKTVGTFCQRGHFAFVAPDDQRLTHDIYVPREAFNGAQEGDKVVVSIDHFHDRHASPEGRVLQVLGDGEDPKVRVLSLALSLDVKADFPEDVQDQADAIPETIHPTLLQARLDLRQKRIFTIDPSDAKDFDDALHICKLPNGHFEVGIHIADVSHYVEPDTPIDREGYSRGTSVYLVDRVIPMLPEKLSNRVCSLRPHEDKLTYTCLMEVSPRGRVYAYRLEETVIHSQARLTYEQAQAIIEGEDHPLADDVRMAARLSATLTQKRLKKGSVDFDLPEIRVLLEEDGRPHSIIRKERLAAHRLVEEFMVLANHIVAQHVGKQKKSLPFVYRIHDKPNAEKIQNLAAYVRAFGHTLDLTDGNADSRALNKLLAQIRGKPEAVVIENAALRAMAKAIYATGNIGHYGLGLRHYTHFTSPIRRYPDLIAHRLLKGEKSSSQVYDEDALEAQCQHCSERERIATEAERESVKLKQVEYISAHLGEQFLGVVTGVSRFGVFIELKKALVEGMVHVRDLEDDYYVYDEHSYSLVGEYTGRSFRPGDEVEVVVAAADLATRQIDLLLAR